MKSMKLDDLWPEKRNKSCDDDDEGKVRGQESARVMLNNIAVPVHLPLYFLCS